MLASTIQRQVPIGSRVTFWCKDGQESTGVLTELGRDHITLEQDSGITTIILESVGRWEIQEAKPPAKTPQRTEISHSQNATTTASDITAPSTQTNPEVLRKLLEIEADVAKDLHNHIVPFKPINNPYAAYAEGGIVDAPEMFYGRQELIESIARVMQESHVQSKSVVIFGQKRSGKSSALHHLKQRLEGGKDLIVLDLGNIGSILDDRSDVPLVYQILWSILNRLEYAIEDKEMEESYTSLNQNFPGAQDFYAHPTPMVYFKEIFDRYKRRTARLEEWCNVRIVLLIDEFSYIHEQIVHERIPGSFMKNWKALLQENYFNVVLVGQDDMPKFKSKFPNEFGTTQDKRVTYLREEDAKKLIDEPIRVGGLQGKSRYLEQAIECILDLTAGSPFYIQIVCNRLVEYMNRNRVSLVTSSDVEQVKDELVGDVNALGLDKFDNLINSGDTSLDTISDEDSLEVLRSIAVNSQQTGLCNRESIDCQTASPVDTVLEDLVHREVIECERTQYYRIRVGLFKEWLLAHA